MRFKGLDLNLLAALDVLLDERNVSRAAERLHLTQPAVSAALARLRDYFGDPILAPQGKRMIPTARALALRPMLKRLLTEVDTMVAQSTRFDPATSDRCFVIGVSDYLVTVLFPSILPALQQAAPGVRLDFHPPSEETRVAIDKGEIDLLLSPAEHCLPDHPAELLFNERHVVVGCTSNPLLAKPISEEDFYAAPHVAVRIGRVNRASFAETHLAERGERRIDTADRGHCLLLHDRSHAGGRHRPAGGDARAVGLGHGPAFPDRLAGVAVPLSGHARNDPVQSHPGERCRIAVDDRADKGGHPMINTIDDMLLV